jgi:hypothetical protein
MLSGKKPMTRYEELRAKAIDCLSLAQKAGNPVVRKELMQLAARFRQLAEHVRAMRTSRSRSPPPPSSRRSASGRCGADAHRAKTEARV